MPLASPHFSDASPESVPQSEPNDMSDSDTFSLDPTIRSQRVTPHQFSHYELLESIGEGQFGTVWRAKDQRLNRIVALKLPHLALFDERRQTLFLREARAAAGLEHPNIVQVHGVDQNGEQPAIISQFIEGQTLFHLLQDQRPSFEESARILSTVAGAVHYAHESGVIHRDLKPSNILMDSEGQPHVSDFGLAKWSGDQALLTNPGIVLGTPAYMSPEQARGDSHLVDRRSDVYSLGVLLYELLTGKPPFVGNSMLLLHQIQSQDPRAPRSHDNTIPLDLETICLKCLAKSPVERYATAHELAEDLRRFLVNEPISARPISFVERYARWTRRNPAVAALVAVSILSSITAIGLGIWLFGAVHQKPQVAALPVAKSVQPMIVTLNTEPEGATVVFYPLDDSTGEPLISRAIRPGEKSPVKLPLIPGDYLVVTALPDGRFHEVYRHVPRDLFAMSMYYPHRSWEVDGNSVSLFPVTIPPRDPEQNVSLLADRRSDKDPLKRPIVRAFLMDRQEVTIGKFIPKFNNALPPSLRHRPELLQSPDLPITGLLLDEAMIFAEGSGKRLPTAMEYEFAATNGWTTRFPWGDSEPPAEAWQLTANYKLFDKTPTESPVFGLFSNASEFVFFSGRNPPHQSVSDFLSLDREVLIPIVRGGPASPTADTAELKQQGARWQLDSPRIFLNEQVGFRCVKSKSPRL